MRTDYTNANAPGVGSIINCKVTGNGMLGVNVKVMYLRNCLIANNNYTTNGAGLLANGNDVTVENCTIVSNTSANGTGAGFYSSYSNISFANTIIYSNQAPGDPNWTATNVNVTFTNCCTTPTNGLVGSGNIASDPLLASYSAGGNYRLTPRSPCINAGLNRSWMTNAVDLDGKTRIRYGTVDMGAYEMLYHGTIYGIR